MNTTEIADMARSRFGEFVREAINPGSDERDRDGITFSKQQLQGAVTCGLWTLAMPRDHGGEAADALTWGVTLEQLGYLAEDTAFPLVLSLRVAVANVIHRAGRRDLDEEYVDGMVRCQKFGSFAYSDGADAFSFRSTIRRNGSGWIATGEKLFVTGGSNADVFMTYLRDETTNDLVVALIEREDAGVEIAPSDVAGVRSAGLARLKLDNVRLAPERILCEEDGLGHAQRFLNERRVLLSAGAIGRMQAILEFCISSLRETTRYGRSLLDMQNVQASLGRMYVGIETARALAYAALRRQSRLDPGFDEMFDPVSSAAKYCIGERAIETATNALRLLGGNGYLRDSRIERYLRDFYGLIPGGGAQDILEVDLGIRAISDFERTEALSR